MANANGINLTFTDPENWTFLADGKQTAIEPKKAWVNGEKTDTDKLDDKGRKSYQIQVLARHDGFKVYGLTFTVHQDPGTLEDLQELAFNGPLSVFVWGSSKRDSSFVTLHYSVEADSIKKEATK